MDENVKPQNPNAFPSTEIGYYDTPLETVEHKISHNGMTLRDYFAAKAIQGILSAQTEMRANGMQNNHSGNQIESLCEESYQIADAMLKQREL